MKATPHWPDACNHGPDAFVGTVDYYHSPATRVIADVYLYHDRVEGLSVCARTGADCHEYMGIGSILNLNRDYMPHQKIGELLRRKVNLTFEIKP